MENEESRILKENFELKERLREAEETLSAIRKADVDAIVVNGPRGEVLYSLVSSDHPYQVFIDNMSEAALIISSEGSILYANSGFINMIGKSSEEVIGSNILMSLEENHRPYFLSKIKNQGQKKSEFSLVNTDGKILYVTVSASKGLWNETESLCLLLNNISDVKRSQNLIEASEAITKIVSEAPNLQFVFQSMIEVLNRYLDWEVVVVWAWNEQSQDFCCTEVAHIPGIDVQAFEKRSRELGSGKKLMFSRVWTSFRPFWFEDVTEDLSFTRRDAALQNKLKGSFAFPFYEDSQLAGVIELFRRKPFREEVDEPLLDLVTSIGIEVGLFIKRKQAEEAKLQFATIVAYSVNGIYSQDKDGIIQSWNPSAERIYGWKAQEMIGTSIKKIYPSDKLHEFEKIWEELSLGKPLEHFQTQRLRKDGKLIWVENAFGPIKDAFGQVTSACVIVQDISLQKESAEFLVQSDEKFRSFVDTTEDWIWEVDQHGNFTFCNHAVTKILGYQSQDVIGKNILYFTPIEDRAKVEEQLKVNFEQKKGWLHLKLRFICKDSSECWVESNAVEIFSKTQDFLGFRGANHDVTEYKKIEKIKNEFISIVSHELRTPLTAIHGALTLLKSREMKPEEIKELIETAQRNSERLTNIINDVIDVEKLQMGKLEYNFKTLDLKNIINDAVTSSLALSKKYDVKLIVQENLPSAQIKGDHMRLVQVLMNLLSNALKFSPSKSEVIISLEETNASFRISVKDCGEGIPLEFKPKIFEKFFQVDSSSKRSYEGTGLGLSICKSIIDAHNGSIQYESEEGKGTTFIIDLPKL